jgi:broad specificity phosphatase PhoE
LLAGSQELGRHEPFHGGTLDPEEVCGAHGGRAEPGSPASVRRLLLVRHAPTAASHTAAFPLDEPLDGEASSATSGLAEAIPARDEVLSSPALRCRQTAAAAGLTPTLDARLAECDFGRWAGSTLAQVHAGDPQGARAWMLDPDAAPHGGETLSAFTERVAGWLDDQRERSGSATVITHGGVIKAAVLHALGAPREAFWRIETAPLSFTEMHAHDGVWTVTRLNCRASGCSS